MNVRRSLRYAVAGAGGAVLLMGARAAVPPVHPDPHRPTGGPVQGTITGTVFDSVSNAPLVNAFVQILKPDGSAVLATAVTDRQGRFRTTASGSGPVLVGAMHPLLDSLGTTHLVRRAEVTPGTAAEVLLGVPTIATLRARWCGAANVDDSTGVMLGALVPRAGESDSMSIDVEARWTDLVVTDSAVTQRLNVLEVTANSDGRFVLCGVPRSRPVAVFAVAGRDSTKARLITTSGRGFDRVDLSFAPVELAGEYADVASLSALTASGGTRLDTVRVRASRDLYTPWYDAKAFEQRRRRGFGVFLGPDVIERRNALRVGDLLATIPNVRVAYTRYGDASIQMLSTTFVPVNGGPVLCTPTFWVDGYEVDAEAFRMIANPREILAMEVYPRAYMAPPQFFSIRNLGPKECGSIVLWTGKRPPRKSP